MTQQLPILPCAENSPDTPDGGSILPLWSYNTMSSIHLRHVYRHSVLRRSVEFFTAGDFFG